MSPSLDDTFELLTKYSGVLQVYIFNANEDNEMYHIEAESGASFRVDEIYRRGDTLYFRLGGETISSAFAVAPRRFEVELGRAEGSFIAA